MGACFTIAITPAPLVGIVWRMLTMTAEMRAPSSTTKLSVSNRLKIAVQHF